MGSAFARLALTTLLLVGVSACDRTPDDSDRPETSREFPRASRPEAQTDKTSISSEQARDDRNEAVTVMDLANIEPGMTVADIGAGDGYYTVRLAERVGPEGRVLAQDIDRDALARLGRRVEDERLDNVSIKLGAPDDPGLPPDSFDRIFLVDMYHEVEEPYAFLWRLRPALAEGGQVIVVDVGRSSDQYGVSPELLFCEFKQVGLRLVEFVRKPELAGYYARFEAVGPRPEPGEIQPCKVQGNNGEASS